MCKYPLGSGGKRVIAMPPVVSKCFWRISGLNWVLASGGGYEMDVDNVSACSSAVVDEAAATTFSLFATGAAFFRIAAPPAASEFGPATRVRYSSNAKVSVAGATK